MNFISGTHTLILYLYILSNKDAAIEAFFKNLMRFRVFWQMFKTIELISGISGLTWIMSLQRRRRSDDSSKRRQLRFGFEKIGNEATTPTSSRKGRVFRTAHRTVLFSSTHWSTTVVSVPVNYQLSEVEEGEVTKWFHVMSTFFFKAEAIGLEKGEVPKGATRLLHQAPSWTQPAQVENVARIAVENSLRCKCLASLPRLL